MSLNIYFATGNACNLRCKYCYLPEHKKSGDRETDEIAVQAARDFVAKCRSENLEIGMVALHGAEPGLLSPEAAAAIANEFSRYNDNKYLTGIQSNGTLFNEEYFERFEKVADPELRFFVGASIDGPAAITDKLRGWGVYKRAVAGLDVAEKRGYRTLVLSVVGSHTVEKLADFGKWMDAQVAWGRKIRLKAASGTYRMNDEDQELFAEWLHRTGYARFYQEINKSLCSATGNACSGLEVDIYGGCYSCNKAYGDIPFACWRSEPLNDILTRRQALYAARRTHPDCKSCEIHPICNSGCPMDRQENGLALDCRLKRTLLSKASSDSGMAWPEIVETVTQYQTASRYGGVKPMKIIQDAT